MDEIRTSRFRFIYRLLHFLHRHNSSLARLLAIWLRKLLPRPKGAVAVPSAYGFRFLVEPDKDPDIDEAIYAQGAVDRGALEILEQLLKPNDTFVDIGAYKGFYTLFAANKIKGPGKIYAFEPHPEAASCISNNLDLNGRQGVQVFPIALGSRDGEAMLYPHTQSSRSTMVASLKNGSQGIPVSVRRLDSILVPYTDIKVMKIDVEGWEMEVLNGAFPFLVKEDAPALIIEHTGIQSENITLFNLFEFLTTINSYRLFRLQKGKHHPSALIPIQRAEDLPEKDKVICLLDSHIAELPKKFFPDLN